MMRLENLIPHSSVSSSAKFRVSLFPHIPRKFTAGLVWCSEKIGFWTLLAILLTVNIYSRVNMLPPYWNGLNTSLARPQNPDLHEALAILYHQQGFIVRATQELQYTESLFSSSPKDTRVLGISTEPGTILNAWENEPIKLVDELAYWQGVVREKPDYRDAYVSLAEIAYQLGKIEDSKKYIQEAIALDPNNASTMKIASMLQLTR